VITGNEISAESTSASPQFNLAAQIEAAHQGWIELVERDPNFPRDKDGAPTATGRTWFVKRSAITAVCVAGADTAVFVQGRCQALQIREDAGWLLSELDALACCLRHGGSSTQMAISSADVRRMHTACRRCKDDVIWPDNVDPLDPSQSWPPESGGEA
jgi:hypothetical protein